MANQVYVFFRYGRIWPESVPFHQWELWSKPSFDVDQKEEGEVLRVYEGGARMGGPPRISLAGGREPHIPRYPPEPQVVSVVPDAGIAEKLCEALSKKFAHGYPPHRFGKVAKKVLDQVDAALYERGHLETQKEAKSGENRSLSAEAFRFVKNMIKLLPETPRGWTQERVNKAVRKWRSNHPLIDLSKVTGREIAKEIKFSRYQRVYASPTWKNVIKPKKNAAKSRRAEKRPPQREGLEIGLEKMAQENASKSTDYTPIDAAIDEHIGSENWDAVLRNQEKEQDQNS